MAPKQKDIKTEQKLGVGRNKMKTEQKLKPARPKLIKFGDLIKPKLAPPQAQEQLPSTYFNFLIENGVSRDSVRLILVKRLEKTDTENHQARLTLPNKKIRDQFLNDEEEEKLKGRIQQGEKSVKDKVKVTVVDQMLVVREMNLSKWNDHEPKPGEKKKSWWLALISGWKDLVARNGFKEGDAIQVWSFRTGQDNGLGFIIQKMDEPKSSTSGSGLSSSSGSNLASSGLSLGSSSRSVLTLDLSLGSSSGLLLPSSSSSRLGSAPD